MKRNLQQNLSLTVLASVLVAVVIGVTGCDDVRAGADLSGADLSGRDLASRDLNHIDLSYANLADTDLFDANLSGATAPGTNLSGADLRWADLSEADFTEAKMVNSVLNSANLVGAKMAGADLSGANLQSANLSEVDLATATMVGADLTGANLRDADLTGAILSGATMHGVDLTGASLENTDLRDADLSQADIFQDRELLSVALGQGAYVGVSVMQELYRNVCVNNAPIPGADIETTFSTKGEVIVVDWSSGRPTEDDDEGGRWISEEDHDPNGMLGDRRYVVCVSSEEHVVHRTCEYIGGDYDITRANVTAKIVDASSGAVIAQEKLPGPDPRWSSCPYSICTGIGDCGNVPHAGELRGDGPDHKAVVRWASEYLGDGGPVGASWPDLVSGAFSEAKDWQVTPADGVQVNSHITDDDTYLWDISAANAGTVTGASDFLLSSVVKEFSASVVVERLSGTGRARQGIYYGYQSNRNKAYVFFVEPGYGFSVWELKGDSFTEVRPTLAHDAIDDGGPNVLRVVVNGQQHQFHINGQLVDKIEVSDYEPGTVGLVADVDAGASAVLEWTNLEVRRPGVALEELLRSTQSWDNWFILPLGLWRVASPETGDVRVEDSPDNESIEVEVLADEETSVVISDEVQYVLRDLFASVRVTPGQTDDESFTGIRFRADGEDENYYLFGATSDGYVAVGRQTDGEFHTIFWSPYRGYKQGRPWEMSVLAIGPEFHFFIDGELVGYLWDDTFSEGYVRLEVVTPADSTARYVLDSLDLRADGPY